MVSPTPAAIATIGSVSPADSGRPRRILKCYIGVICKLHLKERTTDQEHFKPDDTEIEACREMSGQGISKKPTPVTADTITYRQVRDIWQRNPRRTPRRRNGMVAHKPLDTGTVRYVVRHHASRSVASIPEQRVSHGAPMRTRRRRALARWRQTRGYDAAMAPRKACCQSGYAKWSVFQRVH